MVKMDEHFLHSNNLVCRASRELRRRFCRERMEGRLKDDTRRNDLGPQTSSSALYIFTINSFNQCHHRLMYWGFLFKYFPSIQHHFHLRPRNTPSSSVSKLFASLLPISPDSHWRPLFGEAMIVRCDTTGIMWNRRKVRLTDGRIPRHGIQAMVDHRIRDGPC